MVDSLFLEQGGT